MTEQKDFNENEDKQTASQEDHAEKPRPVTNTRNNQGAPEPPTRWQPGPQTSAPNRQDPANNPEKQTKSGYIGQAYIELKGSEIADFESARKLITYAQIAAIVSFFIGGILLSSASLVCAFIANRKLAKIAAARSSSPDVQAALMKLGVMALILAGAALIINIIALVFLYPMVFDAMQSGNVNSLFGGSASSGGAGTSTWG